MGTKAKTYYEYGGDIMSLYGFSKKYNINLGTLQRRIDKGMSMEDALHQTVRPYQYSDIVGKKFNKLTVLAKTNMRYDCGHNIYKCKCDCGNITYTTKQCLVSNHVKSCGCLKKGKKHVRKADKG